MKTVKTFTFLDESGVFNPQKGKKDYFGIGALKHIKPNSLIQGLHPIFESLCSKLRKEESRLEFSFKATTRTSIDIDIQFLDGLLKDDSWEFNCLYFDTNHDNFYKPHDSVERWEKYVTLCKLLLKNNLWQDEETVVIADYQRKPRASRKVFDYIAVDIPQVYNVLQADSHGNLLIQVTDMLLGGYLYSLDPDLGDKEGNKTRISKKVLDIKKKVGKDRFNCWNVDWDKSKNKKRCR